MTEGREAQARDLAVRIAGANHSRRLYGSQGRAWAQTLEHLEARLEAFFAGGDAEVTLALLGDGLAVQGVPITDPPSAVVRFVGQLKARDVEIVGVSQGVRASELEALFAYLAADAADVAAVNAEVWLRERGADRVRIKHLTLLGAGGPRSFREVYLEGQRRLARQFARARRDDEVSVGAMAELSKALLDAVVSTDAPIATLLALEDRDDFTLVHSVNVACLVGAQASTLGLDEAEVEPMVLAALTHDVGKTRVPEEALRADPTGDPRRQAALARARDQHTVEGARLLLDNPAGRLPAVVARFHHTPREAGSAGLLAVELCRIADAFDGVRTLRPFDDAASMHGAVAFLARRMGGRFNPYLLGRFARMVGAAPEGTYGWLDTGEIVLVRAAHRELAFHPAVEVVERREGRLQAGATLDLAAAPARRFVPLLPPAFRDLDAADVDRLG